MKRTYIIISDTQYAAWNLKRSGVNEFRASKLKDGRWAVDANLKSEFPAAFSGNELVEELGEEAFEYTEGAQAGNE